MLKKRVLVWCVCVCVCGRLFVCVLGVLHSHWLCLVPGALQSMQHLFLCLAQHCCQRNFPPTTHATPPNTPLLLLQFHSIPFHFTMGTAPPICYALFKAAHFKELHKIRNIFIITKELLLLFRLCLSVYLCMYVCGGWGWLLLWLGLGL